MITRLSRACSTESYYLSLKCITFTDKRIRFHWISYWRTFQHETGEGRPATGPTHRSNNFCSSTRNYLKAFYYSCWTVWLHCQADLNDFMDFTSNTICVCVVILDRDGCEELVERCDFIEDGRWVWCASKS